MLQPGEEEGTNKEAKRIQPQEGFKTQSYEGDEDMTETERLKALKGNLKNWDWTVFPQFKLEKEDGQALLNLLQSIGKINLDNENN